MLKTTNFTFKLQQKSSHSPAHDEGAVPDRPRLLVAQPQVELLARPERQQQLEDLNPGGAAGVGVGVGVVGAVVQVLGQDVVDADQERGGLLAELGAESLGGDELTLGIPCVPGKVIN